MKKRVILIAVLILLTGFLIVRQQNRNYYDLINAVSGATPLAVARDVPQGATLSVDGLVKQTYTFSRSALSGFATTRIRTREIDPDGQFLGAYIHVGIPVFNILEGIAPQKPADVGFDQPADLCVVFTSASGRTVRFSYNEIVMTDDALPVTLAYHREQILPTNERVRDTYDVNRYPEPLDGLRVIAPRDPHTARYLDNVTRISLITLPVPEDVIPPRRNKYDCRSDAIVCIEDDQQWPATFQNLPRQTISDWIMIGHGHGFDEVTTIEGCDLRAFMKRNFQETDDTDFYLFFSCDGYRCLFSGYEIFRHRDGERMIISDTLSGEPEEHGYRVAPTADFFQDRSMWGCTGVIRIPS